MTYATASITSATPAKDLMAAIKTTLTAAGFTFVESFAGVRLVDIYKSPAAGNQFGQDWYLLLMRLNDAGTAMYYQVAEGYNATTHLASTYGGTGVSVIPVPGTGANPLVPVTPDLAYVGPASLLTTTTAYTYWISATPNRLIVGLKTGSEIGFYAGLYDDLLPSGVTGFPLACAKLPTSQVFTGTIGIGGAAQQTGGFTREPGQSIAATLNFEASVHNGYWAAAGAANTSNYTPSTSTAPLYGNPGSLSRAMIGTTRAVTNNNTGDAVRGLLNGCWTSAVTSAAGDTTTVGGKTYTRFAGPATTFGFFVDQAL